MKTKEVIIEQQKDFIQEKIFMEKIVNFIEINK